MSVEEEPTAQKVPTDPQPTNARGSGPRDVRDSRGCPPQAWGVPELALLARRRRLFTRKICRRQTVIPRTTAVIPFKMNIYLDSA